MNFLKEITHCGAPLYVFPMPHAACVAVGVLVNAGTRDERSHESGIAHALEHMLFQGNERLPDSKAIAGEIEATGGDLNAYTSHEMTFHYRIVPDDSLHTGVDSLASSLTTSLFRPKDVETEMKNIVQEIRRYHDSPAAYCGYLFNEAVHGDHPLARYELGTEASVLGFTRDDFIEFHGRYYHPANFTFIVVGNTTLPHALRAFDRVFHARSGPAPKNIRVAAPRANAPPQKKVAERDIAQAHVLIGVGIDDVGSRDSRAFGLYRSMVDGGMSFPLFQEVRDKRGLCYSVSASFGQSTDRGVFSVSVGTEPARTDEAIACIHDVVAHSCTEELFRRAQKHIVGHNKICYSDPMAVMYQAASDITLIQYPRSPEELLRDLKAVTLEDVDDVVHKHLLDPSLYSYAYVVPHGTHT
jgi:predicted Zn-dependent peptidase